MTKLDQLKALGDAKRAARKSLAKAVIETKVPATPNRTKVETASRIAARRSAVVVPAQQGEQAGTTKAGSRGGHQPESLTARRDGKLKRGRGRPKVQGPRPWELAGVSRATWHRRRQKEQKK